MSPAEQALLHRLAAAGSWVGAADLRQGLAHIETVVDDALADLVMRGEVLFNARTLQYRLAVGPAARKALQRLLRDGSRRALFGAQVRDGSYLVGLARRTADGLLCAEVAMDYPGAAGVASMAPAVAAWLEGDDAA